MNTKKIIILVSVFLSVFLILAICYCGLIMNNKETEFISQNSLISADIIDDFLEIYKNDFSDEIKTDFKANFLKYANNEVIDSVDSQSFLQNSDETISDKFKTWYYSSEFSGDIPLDGTVNFKKVKNKFTIKKNLDFFDDGYKKVFYKQDSLRLKLYNKMRLEIEKGNISFGKRDAITQKIIFSSTTYKLDKFANLKINDLVLEYLEKNRTKNMLKTAMKSGIKYSLFKNCASDIIAYSFWSANILSEEQYNALLGCDFTDISELKKKLNRILPLKLKIEILHHGTNIDYIAKNAQKRGFYTQYSISGIRKNLMSEDSDKNISKDELRLFSSGLISLDGKQKRSMSELASNFYLYHPSKTDEDLIKHIFQRVKIADINTNHCGAIDVLNLIQKKYKKLPKILINFDSHSDMYETVKNNTAQLSDWLNYAVSLDGIEKLIWVVPQENIKNNPHAEFHYFTFKNSINVEKILEGNIDYSQVYNSKLPLVQKFYINLDTREIIPVIGNMKPKGNVKTIEYIVCTQNTLPEIGDEDVFVSVDGDYFNNCGYDTSYSIANIPFDINKSFSEFLNALNNKKIKPSYLSLTVSPEYVSFERIDEIYGFYKYLLKALNMEDEIRFYHNKALADITPYDKAEISEF